MGAVGKDREGCKYFGGVKFIAMGNTESLDIGFCNPESYITMHAFSGGFSCKTNILNGQDCFGAGFGKIAAVATTYFVGKRSVGTIEGRDLEMNMFVLSNLYII